MNSHSRRRFLVTAAASAVVPAAFTQLPETLPLCETVAASMNGPWHFRVDAAREWKTVHVPHTWQIEPETASYMGVAWYERRFIVPPDWRGRAIRIEFEAVFHTAQVSVNGRIVGEHVGKGYTAFAFEIQDALEYGEPNTITVRVDNSFADRMLPRGHSYDWTPDGGIYRDVNLLVTPLVYVERVEVTPRNISGASAEIFVRAVIRNASEQEQRVQGRFQLPNAAANFGGAVPARTSAERTAVLQQSNPQRWHFDQPHLYTLLTAVGEHCTTTPFGIRTIETRDGGLYLNGERVRLAGVERMAGSNPQYGMAEPASWIEHDHDDMKQLNCVFTRVHWQQDRRVLDYCDRHGILIQVEVPTWGPQTFKGMDTAPSPEIMNNGLEQLREMIARDRNHPSVFAWGLCNEVGGQNPAAKEFARGMYRAAKQLDPQRLLTYASNSLQSSPKNDVAGEMDFISWNEYYESWYKGDVESVRNNVKAIHAAFPGKMLVVSEYGYCECAEDRTGGDSTRARILREHNAAFREFPFVGGLIFFDYNDYRTHIGDKGDDVLKQRVHGVVDLYGARKPSFEELRRESSPVAGMEVTREPGGVFAARIRTRSDIPAYTLRRYRLRCIVYGFGHLPMEQHEVSLPDVPPGSDLMRKFPVRKTEPAHVQVDLVRPTGFSAYTATWQPRT